MEFKRTLNTQGDGFWSNKVKKVNVTHLELETFIKDDDYAIYNLYFTKKSWDIEKDGLIYTDSLFLKELKKELKLLGLNSSKLDYTEQGMQGDDYVSLEDDGTLLKSIFKAGRELMRK